jgi:hypothetical protein
MVTAETVQQMWIATLVVYGVVVAVVATMLTLILLTAQRIRDGVAAIWVVGQKVANNTIQIALLDTTNHIVAQIVDSAVRVVSGTAALKAHADGCPGCPACVLGHGGAR